MNTITDGLQWGSQHYDGVVSWGRDLERRHAWLLHQEKLAIGPVDRFYTGVDGDMYKSDLDGSIVTHPVFALATGHVMLAKPEHFIELGPDEANIYITTIDRLRAAITNAVHEASNALTSRVPPQMTLALVIAAVRAQLHALEAHATMPPT